MLFRGLAALFIFVALCLLGVIGMSAIMDLSISGAALSVPGPFFSTVPNVMWALLILAILVIFGSVIIAIIRGR